MQLTEAGYTTSGSLHTLGPGGNEGKKHETHQQLSRGDASGLGLKSEGGKPL